MKCLIFDIWGDFAHFRKFYTTSSPLSFSVPPRTAIAGLISAIIGIDKEEYLKHFFKDQAKIAIRIMKPVNKCRLSYNLIDTKTAIDMHIIKNRTQVTFELLKDCCYRIYFSHTDQRLYTELKQNLKEHKCYYTPCLGLSEHIANFNFIDEIDIKEIQNDGFVNIDTIIPFDEEKLNIQFETGREYFKDTLPNEMNEEREVTQYLKVIYERNCKNIKCDIDSYFKLPGGENIVFL